MTTVEKRRSSRKSGSHRKQNDSYSDTETDREVSSLTDRAFRSLCIGDEAVYNDSDLSASPCIQRDRQLAFSHNVHEREDRDRQEMKRAAHESFSMRVQQYGQDWMYGGTYGAEIHKQHPWGVYGERGSHGRLSATFQRSFLETPQQEPPLSELSIYSNGATEVSSQQRRSRSRVSSLIRAFNSEEQRDGAVMDRKLYNDETSWDKSALMSIERELSEFSSYQQNINTGYFPSAGLFSSQNTNYYSSEVAAVTQMNSASSFMRSSHNKHTMSTNVSSNSNFFIHSEFSPFKVWRDHSRFPFQRGQVSGFMHSSEFPKWYETPMYKELSLQPQQPQQPSFMFEDQGMTCHRNTFAPAVPMNALRSTSTSTVMQKTPAVEKRCESELARHYPHRKRAQSLGANRLPSQRPSTASPTSEMSRRVQDTLSSVKSLQQKIKMMAEQNIDTQSQGVFYNNNLTPYGSNAMIPNDVNTNTGPYKMNHMLTSAVHAAPEQLQVSEHHSVSPYPVEHAPVRAESRGTTPDVKMSGYRSRAPSLFYNLKDNRKRVKSSYSPTKFKGLETQHQYKKEPKDFVIDVPDCPETDILNPTVKRTDRLDVGLHQYGYQTHSPGMLQNSQPAQLYMGQNPMYNSREHYRAQTQGEAAHHHGFTGFTPEYYTNNQLANGQNPHENLSSFTPYKQGGRDKGEALGNYVNRLGQSYTAAEMPRVSADSHVNKANSKHHLNEAVGGEFIRVDRCNQLKENKYDYNTVYSQAECGQTNNQEIQKTGISPTKDHQNIGAYQRGKNTQEELNFHKYNCETKPNRELEKYSATPHRIGHSNISNEVPHYAPLYSNNTGNAGYSAQQQPGTYRESYAPQMSQEYNQENKIQENDAPRVDHKYYNQESTKQTTFSSHGEMSMPTQKSRQGKEPIVKEEGQSLKLKETELQFENSKQKNALAATGQVQVKDEQEQIKTEVDKAGLDQLNLVKNKTVKAKPQKCKEEQALAMFVTDEKEKSLKTKADKDVLAKDEHTKLLPEKPSQAQPHELQKVKDNLRKMMEAEPKRHEPEEQVIVEHANVEKLKEEHIKCQLAKSSKQARIEQVKPELTRKDRVETEQVIVPQVWAEQVLRERTEKEHSEEEKRKSENAEKEQMAENQANTQSEENAQTEMKEAKQVALVTENKEIVRNLKLEPEDPTNSENMQESLSQPAPEQQVNSEPDKVEQAKTELAKAKAELAKIKEKMKGEQKVRKHEETINKVNSNINIYYKEQEPPVNKPSVDQADRGVDEFKHVREKYGFSQAMTTNRNKISTRDKAHSNENIETTDNKKTNTSQDIFTVTTIESNENAKSTSHDDKTESHYVYSESSKEFKLFIASNLADSDDKGTNSKIVEKYDPSPQKDTSQQPPVERKSTEQNIGASTETHSMPLRALTHKERAQTKQEILTSKIKAHAEKEISAIKEGFAIRDAFKNSQKPFALSHNMNVRQMPPSQEAFKKQDSTLLTVVAPKHFSPSSGRIPVKSTGSSPPADHPQKQIKNSEAATEEGITVNEGLSKSEKSLTQSEDKYPITCKVEEEGHSTSPKDILVEKKSKFKALPKLLKDENVDKGDNIDRPDLKIKAPSLQLVFGQSETSVPDDSLKIMGIMVTVRERNREEEKDIQEELCAEKDVSKENGHPRAADVIKVDRLSEGVSQVHNRAAQDNSNAKKIQITRETELMTIMGKRELTDSKTEKNQQKSSLLNDRPQSKKQLTDHLAEKDGTSMNTVQAKNKDLDETKPFLSKHSIVAAETKDHTNRTPTATQATSVIKDQEEMTGMVTKHDPQSTMEISKPSNDVKTQEDLHIDSIAIQVVPAVTDKENMSEQRTISNVPATEEEANETKQMTLTSHQDSGNSNADVQKVLSSVKKQAQLLKISNQQNYNNETNGNTQNNKRRDVHKTGDESKKQLTEEGYFQVERRHSVQQNNSTNVGDTSEAVSTEQELPRSLLNSDTISNKSLKEDKSEVLAIDKSKTLESCSVSIQEGNIKISKLVGSSSDGKSNKDEKMGAVYNPQTRKHHTARDRQSTRSLQTSQEKAVTAKVEVRPKPKVSIPEISALADYARLKVIVSQDNEDTLQELPPNKKEGFFPLIQSHHSRRPVFSADSQEVSVTKKSSQNKSEAPVKPSQEPKPIVFPITEIEHQRTGMFKLGDAKENKGIEDTCVKDGKPIQMEQTKPISPSKTKQNEEPNTNVRIKHMVEERRASLAEEERRAAQREEERRAREREAISMQIRERRKKQERQQEEERKAKLVEQQIDSEIKVKEKEEEEKVERIFKRKEQQRTPSEIHEKPQKMALIEQSININLEECQGRVTWEEQQGKAAATEKKRKSTLEEQQIKAALIEQEREKAVHEEQQRKVALDEHQRKAPLTEEQQRRMVLENQQKKAVQKDERKKRLVQEEQQIALKEKKQKDGLEKQQRKASLGEEQNKMTKEEHQRKDILIEEHKMRVVYDEQQRNDALEEQQRKATLEEQQRKTTLQKQQRKTTLEEQQKTAAALEQKKQRAAHEEQQSKATLEEQKRKAALEEQQNKAALEEQQRQDALEEQQRQAALKEKQKKAALEEQQRKAALEVQQRTAAALEEKMQKAAHEEQQRKAALEEQQRTADALEEKKQRAAHEEQQRQAALKEKQKRTALEEQQRKAAREEQQRTAAVLEEEKQRAAHEEQQRKAALEEQQRTAAALEEEKQRAAQEEQQRKAALEEQQRKAVLEEQQRTSSALEENKQRAAHEEQQRKAALEEQQRKAVLEEQQITAAALEEKKQRAAHEEQQRKAALEEQQRKVALEEQQRKAALEEQQRKATLEEQQRKAAALEEKKQRAAHEEQQRKAALEEQQRKAALEEEQRTVAALGEKKQRAAHEEQQRKAAREVQQRKAALEEQQRKAAALEEKKQRAAHEEQQRKAALEEQQRKAAREEQQRKAALEEQQRKAALEEQQRKAALEQQRTAAALEEKKQRAAREEQQRKAALEEQQRRALQEEQQKKMSQEEQQRKASLIEEQKRKTFLEQQRMAAVVEEQKIRAACEERKRKTSLEEQKQNSVLKEKQIKTATEEKQTIAALTDEQKRKTAQEEQLRKTGVIKEQKRSVALEEEQQRRAALEEQQRKEALVEKQRRTRQVEEEKRLAYIREERIRRQIEEEKDAQIAEERRRQQSQQKSKAVQLSEKVRQTKDKCGTSEKDNKMLEQGQTVLVKDRVTREQDLPQRETDIRAIQSANQAKASEIEEHKNVSEKTDALQYYSLTSAEAEKLSPPQQRNSTNGHERAEDPGSYNTPHAPVSPAPSLPRSSASSPALVTKPSMFKVKDNTIRGSAFTKSIKPRFHKNFGEEFRVGSPMEQVLKKCEEEQDILRRSAGTPVYPEPGLNKPAPTTQGYSTPVPQHRPYLRRSLVLDEEDAHSIISNMSEDVESFATSGGDLADIRALYDSERPDSACSFSSDVSRSFGKPPAVPPKSEKALRRAKRLATRRLKKEMPKAVTDDACKTLLTEVGITNHNAVASPHFASPVSLAHVPTSASSLSSSHPEYPAPQRSFHTSPHATAPISLPIASPHTTAPVSTPIASSHNAGSIPNSAASKTIVSSSPALRQTPKPVTQYQVESTFPQSYPVTQRRVLQDIGSGQYYVVDVPVEVKTKTFFDPETGKYVQLNVRESSRNTPQRQPLQAYPQPQLKPQVQAKAHQQPPPAAKPNTLYQGYPGDPKGYQSAATSSGPPHQSNSVTPATFTQDQQPISMGHNHRYDGPEIGYRYSPEKTPYMDTVSIDKTYNAVYSTQDSHGAFSEGDTNSRSHDIITIGELEDFMEVSDWRG